MKLLVLLAVLLIAYLVWRNARAQRRDAGTRPPGAPAAGPVEMVSCPECGVHLPKTDALPGPDGRFYCCNEHRLRGGG